MGAALTIVKQAYDAFGRRDIDTILELVDAEVDWELIGPANLSYAGHRSSRNDVREFFAALEQTEKIHVFEPREYIEAGEHVTVLGWEKATALDTGKDFETEWIHVFTVQNNKVTRWRGIYNTAARYGME